MPDVAKYSFDLGPDELDAIRSHMLAAQTHHLERARHFRGLAKPEQYARAAREAESAANQARGLWALLAGVRSVRCEGQVPIGHVQASELLRFLDQPG